MVDPKLHVPEPVGDRATELIESVIKIAALVVPFIWRLYVMQKLRQPPVTSITAPNNSSPCVQNTDVPS
jgi:hypothetical protein